MDLTKGHGGGIQMLLAAEKEAQEIISKARNLRTARLKQAKDEAEREAAAYRASLEEEYKKKVSEASGSSGCNVKRLDEETENKIRRLKEGTAAARPDVVAMLLRNVKTA